ncbi:hypothetical protein FACS189415_8140 [Bacteroidia bacterium]|nr:hypothetical protein FACS189415_8140 [Bacteroidia bacterium]
MDKDMDKLKDFIGTHREAFDDELLPEGHFERFEEKLGRRKRATLRFTLLAASVAAAAGLFIFLKAPSIIKENMRHPASSVYTCEAEKEIEELRLYYNMQIYGVVAQMKDLYAAQRSPGSLELLEESEQVVYSTYDFEENILPSLPCSDGGLFAMTQHYSNSLESLNFMLGQMKQITSEDYHN